jgi:acetyl-CoA C-acetyltransferase
MAPTTRPAGHPVVVTHALRTPIGKFLGSLADLSAADLGVSVVSDLLARSKIDPRSVSELVFGNARQAGGGPNVARQIAVRSGLPVETPAWTVNMACASGLKSIALAADSIRAGRGEIAIAGGTESMSRLPYLLPEMRRGYRLGHAPVVDGMYRDGFLCPLSNLLMGETADKLARELDIARDEQDRFALESQQKSQRARTQKRFEAEISPVAIKTKQGERLFANDEHARDDATLEDLRKLKPVFDAQSGTVTAGNASGITDGAAALLLMSADAASRLGFAPLAFVGHTAQVGVDPSIMGIGPVPAVRRLSEQNGLAVDDYDLIELNEAFAAQVIACDRELRLPRERLNVNGGAISLGHPIGCTGARIVVTLLHEMNKRKSRRGLATLCVSGGLGMATAFERDGA